MGNRDKLRAANQAKQTERLNPTVKPQIESLTDDIKKRAEEKIIADAQKEAEKKEVQKSAEKPVEIVKAKETTPVKPTVKETTKETAPKKEIIKEDQKPVEVKKEVSITESKVDIKTPTSETNPVKKHAGGRPKKALSETRNNTCKQISVWLPNEIVDFLQEEKIYYDNNITKCITGIIKKEMKRGE